MTSTQPTFVAPGEGARYRMTDGDHVAKAAVADAAGAFELFEIEAPAGVAVPPHVSPWSGVLYVVEGRVTVHVGGADHDLGPGGVAVLPAGTACTFAPVDGPARFVAVTSGDGAGRFFADFAATVPPDVPVEEAVPHILAVTARHGVEVAGAP